MRPGLLLRIALAAMAAVGAATAASGQQRNDESFPELLRRAQSSRGAEAVVLWRRVVEQNPTVADYWQRLGETLVEAGQYRDAVSAHGRAIDLGAGYPWSSPFAIARIHARQRHADSTLFWLDEALRKRYRDLDRIRAD